MKKIGPRLRILILAVVLLIISFGMIVIFGNKYTVKIKNVNLDSVDDLIINYSDTYGNDMTDKVVRCINKEIKDDNLILTFESISEGKVFVDVKKDGNDRYYYSKGLYVHSSGVITEEYYMGNCTFGKTVPIASFIVLLYVYYLLMKAYRESMNENMFKHINVFYLGILIIFGITLINQFAIIFDPNYGGIHKTIYEYLKISSQFTHLVFPVAFIVAILVTIFNIILIKKEGFSLRNTLGLFLGIIVCILPFVPSVIYLLLNDVSWIDVHNEKGIGVFIMQFIEITIYTLLSYFECILLSSIILSVKAARKIPSFDKDYIIILGCKIKKDGGLTNLLKGRVDRAIEFRNMQKEKTGKKLVFVPSGGKGEDEICSEGEAMEKYLIENGIPKDEILSENKSVNTYENFKNSYELIKEKSKDANIAFSTTNYHVFRAGITATNQGIKTEGIGSKTRTYFWTNAFIREFIASLYYQRKEHIRTIIVFWIACMTMVQIMYVSNFL